MAMDHSNNKMMDLIWAQAEKSMAIYHDPSHDLNHVHRVHRMAMKIGLQERTHHPEIDMGLVEISSILHDVLDHKYADGSELDHSWLISLLRDQCQYARYNDVLTIITHVSFSKQSKTGLSNEEFFSQPHILPLRHELAIVKDADMLDAIGAIGIARCFMFGGKRNRDVADSLNHFHEKLVKIYDRMCTDSGKEMARERHARTVKYAEDLADELGQDEL